jgi:hypothetical protein
MCDENKDMDSGSAGQVIVGVLGAAAVAAAIYMACGCSSLKDKTVAAGGTVSALKIESSGSASTGTPTPTVMLGGAAFAFADSPDTDRKPVYVRAARSSFLSRLFRAGLDDSVEIYIGCPGESADATVTRIKALKLDGAEPAAK